MVYPSPTRSEWALALVGLLVLVTGVGCEPADGLAFVNDTTVVVTVQRIGAGGVIAPVGVLRPGEGGATRLDTDAQGCSDQEFRAVDASGQQMDRLTRECGGQTWHIRAH